MSLRNHQRLFLLEYYFHFIALGLIKIFFKISVALIMLIMTFSIISISWGHWPSGKQYKEGKFSFFSIFLSTDLKYTYCFNCLMIIFLYIFSFLCVLKLSSHWWKRLPASYIKTSLLANVQMCLRYFEKRSTYILTLKRFTFR